MRKLKIAIAALVIAGVLVPVFYIFYLWATCIDDVVTSGEAYGFSIGEDKLVVYQNLPANLNKIKPTHTSKVYFEVQSDARCSKLIGVEPGYRVLVEAILHKEGFYSFKPNEQWVFYIDGSYSDKISLTFCGDRLCEIYRHRKHFEFP